MELTSVLSALTGAAGVSGLERPAAETAARLLSPYAKQVSVTPRGSVIGRICEKPNTPYLLLDAHIDEIGMMISKIEPDGMLRFLPVGGLDRRLLCGQPVTVHGTKEIPADCHCGGKTGRDDGAGALRRMPSGYGGILRAGKL